MEKDEFEEIKSLLNSIGIRNFISYYTDFKDALDKNDLIKLFQENGEDWKESSMEIIARTGIKIFEDGLEAEALFYIANHPSIKDKNIQTDAKLLMYEMEERIEKEMLDYDPIDQEIFELRRDGHFSDE